ncbi:MAG: ATP-binding protein [Pseudomonadota bacterium]
MNEPVEAAGYTSARSLAARLLMAALLLLPLTLGGTAFYLERAHRSALDAATSERLQLQVLTLLAQAEFSDEFRFSGQPVEPRLTEPASGLYALITDAANRVLWSSPSTSLLGDPLTYLAAGVPALNPGERHDSEANGLFRHAYQVLWDVPDQAAAPLRFLIAESSAPRDADLKEFRKSVWLWLGVTLVLVLLIQLLIFRWGLKPLRTLGERIGDIERGDTASLDGAWPAEVQPLVRNLDTLLTGEQRRRERMRNTLSDLAHSLKTPVAVLRSADRRASDFATIQKEQLDRMEEVVSWHLQRAVGGNHRLLQRIALAPVLERLRATLLKVYAGRDIEIEIDADSRLKYRGDERDLMEVLGNLLDNACKYGHRKVHVSASFDTENSELRITVDDDGDGISPELRDSLLQRGVRADTRTEGQGLGLALVRDLLETQGGRLTLDNSPAGGARVQVFLPS